MLRAARAFSSFAFAAALALAACSGSGHSAMPGVPAGTSSGLTSVRLSLNVPKANVASGKRSRLAVSPSTQSVSIVVDAGTPSIFNTTPGSSGCTVGSGGTTCTFSIGIAPGVRKIAVTTFSLPNGAGSALNGNTITQTILANTVNTVALFLDTLVTALTDSGPGSLRQVLADASPGDTIGFAVTGTIGISQPLNLTKNVTISGPGPAALTVSGGGEVLPFTIPDGVTATISGITVHGGFSSTDGGAIANAGTLSLSNDAFTQNSSGGCGGAIANTNHALTIDTTTFTGNASTQPVNSSLGGGAICTAGPALTITASTFTSNTAVVTAGAISSRAITVSIDGTTFQSNSSARAGAVALLAAPGTVTATASITNSKFLSNAATVIDSGAIENALTLTSMTTISNTTFDSNTAISDAGAIENDSPLTLTSSLFHANSALGNGNVFSGDSGAIEQDDMLTATNVTFDANTAHADSGAMENDFDTVLTNVTFTNNHAGEEGGAIENDDTIFMFGGKFSGNSSAAYGGAYVEFGSIGSLNNVTIDGNTAVHQGGGLMIDSESFINACTISNNTVTGTGPFDAGGGIASVEAGGPLPVIIVNSTISGNSAPRGGGIANGGTLTQSDGTLPVSTPHNNDVTLLLVTIANNQASVSGGNVYNFPSPPVLPLSVTRRPLRHRKIQASARRPLAVVTPAPLPPTPLVIVNTMHIGSSIVSGGTATVSGPNLFNDTGSAIASTDYNLFFGLFGDPISGLTSHNIATGVDPKLGPLANNGGTTFTHALLAGSPAIDAIPLTSCFLTTDGRGFIRPHGAACDIGAFEL
jgi:fibronectin-binding autotransporter adhesin